MNEALRGLLGWSAVAGPFVVWPSMSALLAYAAVRLRARTLRRHAPAACAHWTERARFADVARREGRLVAALVVMMTLCLGIGAWRTDDASWLGGLLVVVASVCAVVSGHVGFLHAYPSLGPPEDVRGARLRGFVWPACVFGFWLFIPLFVAPFTTPRFDTTTWLALASGMALLVTWSVVALPAARAFGVLVDPSDALLAQAHAVARRMGVEFNSLWVLRWHVPNAFALPLGRNIAVSDRLLELLNPEEVEAVLAHELGHLRERWPTHLTRLAGPFAWFSLSAGLPVYGAFGFLGVMGLYLAVVAVLILLTKVSRNAERAADGDARTHTDSPTYARALEKLHEAALLPAVTIQRGGHPDLYDRMEAAGVCPAYAKPEPPNARGAIAVLMTTGIMVFVAMTFLQVRAAIPGGDTFALTARHVIVPLDAYDLADASDQANLGGDRAGRARLAHAAFRMSPELPFVRIWWISVLVDEGRCREALEVSGPLHFMRLRASAPALDLAGNEDHGVDQQMRDTVLRAVGECATAERAAD